MGASFMVKANEPGQAAVALGIMASYAAMLGDLDLAQGYLEQAFRYCSGLEESLNYAFVLYLSAQVMIFDGRPDAVKLGLKQQSLGLEYTASESFSTRLGIGLQETFTNKFTSFSDDKDTQKIEKFKLE